MIDVAEFVGVGMDMDKRLFRVIGRDQRESIRGGFAQPRSDGEDQVGLADALLQLWVGPVTELPRINSAAVRKRILPAERRSYRDAIAEREIPEVMRRPRAPVGAADDRNRVGRFLEQFEQLPRFGCRL